MVYSSLKENGEIHSQAELAKAIGASEATISKALKGEEKALTDNLFKRISKRFARYSLDWMINGIGNMMNNCGCSDPNAPFETPPSDGTYNGLTTDSQRTHNGGTTEAERIKFLEEQVAFYKEQTAYYKEMAERKDKQ